MLLARLMCQLYPAATLVILADLLKDHDTPHPQAIAAAQTVGARLAIPNFGANRPTGATDFNDLARLAGIVCPSGVILRRGLHPAVGVVARRAVVQKLRVGRMIQVVRPVDLILRPRSVGGATRIVRIVVSISRITTKDWRCSGPNRLRAGAVGLGQPAEHAPHLAAGPLVMSIAG